MSNALEVNKQARFTLAPSQKEISHRVYNLIIGATLLYGFAVNAFMINNFQELFLQMNMWVLLIGYIVCIIIGAMLTRSDSPVVSFIGYNFIVVPFGVILTILLPAYSSDIVFDAVVITGFITIIMMILGGIFPRLFLGMGRTLFITLLATILVELVCVFIFHKNFAIFDYVVVLIFSGYIGYDWAKANAYRKTVNNAIDSAIDLYMDIINIFVRILAILSRNQR